MRRHARVAVLAVGGAGALALVGGNALTADNQVTGGSIGQGIGVVSGFNVDNVRYTMNLEPDPLITIVNFKITRSAEGLPKVLPANSDVFVRLQTGQTLTTRLECDIDPTGDRATCIVSELEKRASEVTGISVLAYDTPTG